MCILLGAITPDHAIKRMGSMEHYLRFTRTKQNRETLRRVHGR